MTGRNARRFADLMNGPGVVFLVDEAGGVHALSATAYSSLTSAQLAGTRVFITPQAAEAHSRRIKSRN